MSAERAVQDLRRLECDGERSPCGTGDKLMGVLAVLVTVEGEFVQPPRSYGSSCFTNASGALAHARKRHEVARAHRGASGTDIASRSLTPSRMAFTSAPRRSDRLVR